MYLVFAFLLGICFYPFHISFKINSQCLTIGWFHFPLKKVSQKTKRVTTQISKPKFRRKKYWNFLKKVIRLKSLEMTFGYQCEMIDQSMYFYSFLLLISPLIISILDNQSIQTHLTLQNIPIKNSQVMGMIEICLVRLLIG